MREDGKIGKMIISVWKKTDTKSVSGYCSTWIKAYKARNAGDKEMTLKLVQKATAGFVGTADWPPADFMLEMMELYREAKVVLVRRDSIKWWNSVAALTSRMTPPWLGILMAPIRDGDTSRRLQMNIADLLFNPQG
jgi:hypothetical protein